jgi:hypothetical protein
MMTSKSLHVCSVDAGCPSRTHRARPERLDVENDIVLGHSLPIERRSEHGRDRIRAGEGEGPALARQRAHDPAGSLGLLRGVPASLLAGLQSDRAAFRKTQSLATKGRRALRGRSLEPHCMSSRRLPASPQLRICCMLGGKCSRTSRRESGTRRRSRRWLLSISGPRSRANRDAADARRSIAFLHQASRYRGKANYRDAIFLAYGPPSRLRCRTSSTTL